MTNTHDHDLRALIELLRDDDAALRARVTEHLARRGDQALPALEQAAAETDSLHRVRLQFAGDSIRRQRVLNELRAYRKQGAAAAVEEGALLIAQLAYPALDRQRVRRELDALAQHCPAGVRDADPLVSLEAFRHYIHVESGFHGNHERYYDPENSLLNRVLARRTGIPITLAVVYMAVARRVNRPIAGIGLPGHFVVLWSAAEPAVFLDPFNGGQALRAAQCRALAARHGAALRPEHLKPVSPQEIAARIARNLVAVWRQMGDRGQERLARQAHACLRPDVSLPE